MKSPIQQDTGVIDDYEGLPRGLSRPDRILKDQLECLLAPKIAQTIFTLRFILLDILTAWGQRKTYE
jgi:hypothetical protein